MQKIRTVRLLPALLLSGLLPLTACDAPKATEVPAVPPLANVSGETLLECPTNESRAAEERILPLGGSVGLDGHLILVPEGALDAAADIRIEAPASLHMRVELTANDQEHWQFLLPVTVTIDYSRCSNDELGSSPLSVWHIDSKTGALLQNMDGIDDRLLKQITFTTDHFSGYAIAN